ncbi:MAG: FISUMP domain-containing protein [Flavobacteriales bacterium]
MSEYGRLYNWYAVDDARGLCPNGWHIPSFGGGFFVALPCAACTSFC